METTADQNLQKDVFVAGWGATNERGRDPADALQKLNVPLFPGKDTNQIGCIYAQNFYVLKIRLNSFEISNRVLKFENLIQV